MHKISLMSWNTQLYEYGNKLNGEVKQIKDSKFDEKIEVIKNHLKKESAVAVLQEIPYKTYTETEEHKPHGYHYLFKKFTTAFPSEDYKIIFFPVNPETEKETVIKMTVVIAKKSLDEKELISKYDDKILNDSNIYVPFKIKMNDENTLNVLGVHAHDAVELREWLAEKQFFSNVILGDFNAGNYKKNDKQKDNKIVINRQNYLLLTEGYIDVCQGMVTTEYETQIDHILLENNNDFSYSNVKVDGDIKFSDHYPIYCDIEIKKIICNQQLE